MRRATQEQMQDLLKNIQLLFPHAYVDKDEDGWTVIALGGVYETLSDEYHDFL